MASNPLKFHIKGDEARKVADALKDILNDEVGVAAETLPAAADAPSGETRGIDPTALAALVLSIPAVALATADLVDRIKKRKQVERALERTKQLLREKTTVTIRIEKPDGTTIELNSATVTDLLDSE